MNNLRHALSGLQRFQGYLKLPNLSEITSQDSSSSSSSSPSKLTIQIILLQCFYYITATVLSFSIAWILGLDFNFGWVFNWDLVSLDNSLGLTIIGMWLFDSLLCVLFMTIIVGRSKLAWDFAITIHAINLIVVWIYSGEFPRSFVWWSVQVGSCLILVSLGTWSTRWKELRETFFEGIVDVEMGHPGQRSAIEMRDVSEDH